MTSPDLAVLAREWLRDYHSLPEAEPAPPVEMPQDATQLPNHNN